MKDVCLRRKRKREEGPGPVKRGLIFLCMTACVFAMISCNKDDSGRDSIKIQLMEQTTKDGTVIQIPEFVSDNEETKKALRPLEKETKDLQKMVEKEQRKGTHMEMRCYLNEEKNYPQVTVIWYLSEEDTRTYELMTLGFCEKEREPITCKEALERTGMTGVDLSLQVGRLAQESGIRGELTHTEMQGFRIDQEGVVREIYMKLLLETVSENSEEEIINTEEHYFSYYPEEKKLVKLSELGFDVP